jgi:hypothetical protein
MSIPPELIEKGGRPPAGMCLHSCDDLGVAGGHVPGGCGGGAHVGWARGLGSVINREDVAATYRGGCDCTASWIPGTGVHQREFRLGVC